MKNFYKLIFIIFVIFILAGCDDKSKTYQIYTNDELTTEFYLGEDLIDFKAYFSIKDEDGNIIEIEDAMIDISNVDINKEGKYKIKLNYNGLEKEIEIIIIKKDSLTYTIKINDSISKDISKNSTAFDFKSFFSIKDSNGNIVEVLDSYIDASAVDFSNIGSYTVKIHYQDLTEELIVNIINEQIITYEIIVNEDLSRIIDLGIVNLDFTKYFQIVDSNGNNIEVLDTMINQQNVDLSKAGKFVVILNYMNLVKELEFNIIAKEETSKNASDLFISEYAEGKNYDKYIEIFNGTGETIDLSNYSVSLFNNSKLPAQYTVNLSGELKDGEIFIIYNPSASSLIKSSGNIANKVIEFNGNDVIALSKDGKLLDVFGDLNNFVETAWDVCGVIGATKDHTLIRKSKVYGPSNIWDPNEWIVLDNEDFSNIKIHLMDGYTAIKDEEEDIEEEPKRTADIFISEYFEGDKEYKDSKYIEIYNGLGIDVNLEDYFLAVYKNGLTAPDFVQQLNGILKDKEVYIVYAPYSANEIKNKGSLASEVCYFNGNAAIALLKGEKVIDVIGVIGEYPDGGWIVDDYSTTKNNTIIRKEYINSPISKWDENEWYPCYDNYLYGLGNHFQENIEDKVYDDFSLVLNMIKELDLDSKGTATSKETIKVKGTIYMDVKSETTLVYITDGKNFIELHGEKIHNSTTPGLVYEIVCYYKAHLYHPTLEVTNPTTDITRLTTEIPVTEIEVKEVTLVEILSLKKENFVFNITNGYLQSMLKINGYLQIDTHNSTRFDYCLTTNETYLKNDTGYIDNSLYFKNDVEDLEAYLSDFEVVKGQENIKITIYGVIYDWNPNRKNWRIYIADALTIGNLIS